MKSSYCKMSDLNLANQRVLIREDLNAPLENGCITNDERIQRALPTLRLALKQNARVMVLSHLGRPLEGQFDAELSLAPVAKALSQALDQEVLLVRDWLDGVTVAPGQIVLCENARFNVGEKENDATLSQRIAALCDVFVMDAFATAHRAEASTVGVQAYAPIVCAGPLLDEELIALGKVLDHPEKPLVAIVGGAKVSTKFHLLQSLLDKVNTLIVGGGIANTLLVAAGFFVGKSLYEPEWIETAKSLLENAKLKGVHIPLPVDVVVATEFSASGAATVKAVDAVLAEEMILDVGPKTAASYRALMANAKTIVWNGPVGVFEFEAFSHGTEALGCAIAMSSAYSIAGGGDTLAAVAKYHLTEKISYICTGGGAFLEYLQGDVLPAVAMLQQRALHNV